MKTTKPLIKKCKMLMLEHGLDRQGGQKRLAKALSVNRNSLSMALSGFRAGPASVELLEFAIWYLTNNGHQL